MLQLKIVKNEVEGTIVEVNGRRAYIQSDEGDYIGSQEHFIFDPQYGHSCLIVGMPVVFDVVENGADSKTRGRRRASNVRIVDWLYPSLRQAELVIINWSSRGGTASMACGCHVSLYPNQFRSDPQYVDDPAVMQTGRHLVADVVKLRVRQDGIIILKATNTEILGWEDWEAAYERPVQDLQSGS